MSLTIIFGGLGSGKTALAVHCALQEKERPIYANFYIKADNAHIVTPDMIKSIKGGGLFIYDEAWAWLESRGSGNSAINKIMSYLLYQSRKRNEDYILTVQQPMSIDIRFRMLCDRIIKAQKSTDNRYFKYTILDINGTDYKKRYKQMSRLWAEEFIFPYYNTYEEIDSVLVDMEDIGIFDKNKLLPEIDEIIKDMGKHKAISKWTKAGIDGYCLDKKYGDAYAKIIYDRIKYKFD